MNKNCLTRMLHYSIFILDKVKLSLVREFELYSFW